MDGAAVCPAARGRGPPRKLADCTVGTALGVTPAGIYYMPCPATLPADSSGILHLIDPATRRDRYAVTLERFRYSTIPGAFAVSPDGTPILYEREVRSGGDIMMIENFR